MLTTPSLTYSINHGNYNASPHLFPSPSLLFSAFVILIIVKG
jgi:hypothetical protein